MSSLNGLELWIVGGMAGVVLWCGIVLPIGYRLVLVPLGQQPFWSRMRAEPNGAVLLILLLLVFGPAVLYAGMVGLMFVALVFVFRVVFAVFLNMDP